MAARENQGLQIALIIFVVLTILLIVTTFLFFRNYREEQDKNAGLNTQITELRRTTGEAEDTARQLKNMIGAPETENKDAIVEASQKSFEANGKTLAEGDQNYRGLVKYLVDQLNSANARIAEITAHEKELTDKIATDEELKNAEIAKYNEQLAQAAADLQAERDKFNQQRADMDKSQNEMTGQMAGYRRQVEEVRQTSGEQISGLRSENTKLTSTLQQINEEKARGRRAAEVPDGQITGVNQRNRTVWVNLGSADGLRKQVSFSVFSQDESNPAEGNKKAKIEVINLVDAHTAEARIIEDDLKSPIMPGDLVFNPAWEPGRPEHFALAGLMDVNGDGDSDRQQIYDLIAMNGGVIDAELTDDGKRTGEMSIGTKYLVLGEKPKVAVTAASEGNAALDAWADITAQAKTLGVQTISMHTFLDYLGYTIEDRTVGLGRNAKPADFKPRLPDGVQRVIPGNEPSRDIRRPVPPPKITY